MTTAIPRRKNNIIHLYDGETVNAWYTDGPMMLSICGSCREDGDKDSFELQKSDLDEGYVIRDGDIKGKVCGNCVHGVEQSDLDD